MGVLTPEFTTVMLEEMLRNVQTGVSFYYLVASTATSNTISNDDYNLHFEPLWNSIFGKQMSPENVAFMINNIPWQTNTVYSIYDNTQQNLFLKNYYVISPPIVVGGDYLVYKCIDNANNAASVYQPTLIQPTTFTLADGYKWRYITTIPSARYNKFTTNLYVPIYANTAIQAQSWTYAGVETVMVSNNGSNYSSYHSGTILSVVNTTCFQVAANASPFNNFYVPNGFYVYNDISITGQLFVVSTYASNSTGNFVFTDKVANTDNIIPNQTKYIISPQVIFETDGVVQPQAYSVVNTAANNIFSIVPITLGSEISWANVQLISNTFYGSGANAYAIVPPKYGHGYDPFAEFYTIGLGMFIEFNDTESNTIPLLPYNQLSVIHNPNILNSNNTPGNLYTALTFNQLLTANVSPPVSFTVGSTVQGLTSGALGQVQFSNSTVLWLSGDKFFQNGETVSGNNGATTTSITINTYGGIYTQNLKVLYNQILSENVVRTSTTDELYKVIFQV